MPKQRWIDDFFIQEKALNLIKIDILVFASAVYKGASYPIGFY
jgi:hypothetical protein